MAEKLSKEWFEFRDIDKNKFSLQDKIRVYQCETKTNTENSKNRDIGYEEEHRQIYSLIIKNGSARKQYSENMDSREERSYDEFHSAENNLYARANVDEKGNYQQVACYYSDEGECLGFKLVLRCNKNPDNPSELTFNQDFILVYDLMQKGDGWFEVVVEDGKRIPNENKQVIWQRRDSNGRLISIDIRTYILKDYLALHKASLRLCYFIHREYIFAENPNYWDKEELKRGRSVQLGNTTKNKKITITQESAALFYAHRGCKGGDYVEGEMCGVVNGWNVRSGALFPILTVFQQINKIIMFG